MQAVYVLKVALSSVDELKEHYENYDKHLKKIMPMTLKAKDMENGNQVKATWRRSQRISTVK